MKVTIIVAKSRYGVIGTNGVLPWKSRRDMAHFVECTIGKYVLMGRKTYESIARELKGREVLILSGNPDFKPTWGRKVGSVEEVQNIVGRNELMVAGGAKVYELMMPLANKMIITTVASARLSESNGRETFSLDPNDFSGEIYFPQYEEDKWFEESSKLLSPTIDESLALQIRTLIRADYVFLTADQHLGETRMEIMQRPFYSPNEMADCFIQNHNAIVDENDLVFFAGDIINKDADPNIWLPLLKKFNGRKILFRGNHERKLSDFDLAPYFLKIYPEGTGKAFRFSGVDCWINHYPTQGREDKFNLVGHVHGAWKVQLNMLNIGVDANHFSPHSSARIPFYKTAIEKFFDNDVWVAYNKINSTWIDRRGNKSSYFNV